MKTILELKDEDVGLETKAVEHWPIRTAARGVVFHGEKIALLHASKVGIYKLPGGGAEGNEDPIAAFKRECIEEIGCDVEVVKELGITIEHKSQKPERQTSHCFLAKAIEPIGEPAFDEGELRDGFEALWVTPEEATRFIAESKPSKYTSNFVVTRDAEILRLALTQKDF